MEAIYSFETFVPVSQTIRRYVQRYNKLQINRRESFKSHTRSLNCELQNKFHFPVSGCDAVESGIISPTTGCNVLPQSIESRALLLLLACYLFDLLFHPEEEVTMFFRNVGKLLTQHTASHPVVFIMTALRISYPA
jgi:hypothetical protein